LVILAGQQHATPAQRAYQVEKASTWAVSVLYKAYAGHCGVFTLVLLCCADLLLVLMLCCCQAVLDLQQSAASCKSA
jgi:hypothetical protein